MFKNQMFYWCEECNTIREPKIIDIGIGPYEYWGSSGFDNREIVACEYCENILYHFDGESIGQEVTIEDL